MFSTLVIYTLFFVLILSLAMIRWNVGLLPKLALIAGSFYIASAIYFSFDSYMGWPAPLTENTVPTNKLQVVWALISEPTQATPGLIEVWVLPDVRIYNDKGVAESKKLEAWYDHFAPWKVFGYSPKYLNMPRAFDIPYTREYAEKMSNAQQAIQEGSDVYISLEQFMNKDKKKKQQKQGQQGEEGKGNSKEGNGDPSNDPDKKNPDVSGFELEIVVPNTGASKNYQPQPSTPAPQGIQ